MNKKISSPETRNAILQVITPNIYPSVLLTDDHQVICENCTRKNLKTLIADLNLGINTGFSAVSLATISGGVICDCCSNYQSAYWESVEEELENI